MIDPQKSDYSRTRLTREETVVCQFSAIFLPNHIIFHREYGVGVVRSTNWKETSVIFVAAEDRSFDTRELKKAAFVIDGPELFETHCPPDPQYPPNRSEVHRWEPSKLTAKRNELFSPIDVPIRQLSPNGQMRPSPLIRYQPFTRQKRFGPVYALTSAQVGLDRFGQPLKNGYAHHTVPAQRNMACRLVGIDELEKQVRLKLDAQGVLLSRAELDWPEVIQLDQWKQEHCKEISPGVWKFKQRPESDFELQTTRSNSRVTTAETQEQQRIYETFFGGSCSRLYQFIERKNKLVRKCKPTLHLIATLDETISKQLIKRHPAFVNVLRSKLRNVEWLPNTEFELSVLRTICESLAPPDWRESIGKNIVRSGEDRVILAHDEFDEVFTTVTETTKGIPLPRWAALKTIHSLVVFDHLEYQQRGGNLRFREYLNKRGLKNNRKWQICFDIDYAYKTRQKAAEELGVSTREVDRYLFSFHDKIREIVRITSGGPVMFDHKKLSKVDFVNILKEGGVWVLIPPALSDELKPTYEVHRIADSPQTAIEGMVQGLGIEKLRADLLERLTKNIVIDKKNQTRFVRSKPALERSIEAAVSDLHTRFQEAFVKDFGQPGDLFFRDLLIDFVDQNADLVEELRNQKEAA